MRSILLHIYDDDCLNARLQVALDLARSFDGHVTCLQATPFLVGMPGDLYGMAATEVLPELRRVATKLRDRLEQRLKGEDVAWDWVQIDALAADQLIRRSGLSDVVVLGSCEPMSGKGPARLAGDVILRGRSPVLVVPPNAKRLDCTGEAIVAWDGSAESMRALRAAVPLLAKARSVELLTVKEDRSQEGIDLPPVEGAEYLSRHGIGCEMTELPRTGSAAETLVYAAETRDAAYLVMGAYGHSRLLETVWGGFTRRLLTAPPIPILACH